ncbi:hypothetical protein TVAG_352160 [Trichomonas vaginalis G3]|uniref:Uncharacterized protein n=1 Tax=Trichomonas vaginalis (strain ATCC PRA-98 / G3) TaxID=412133 RepID=A2G4Q3_TRIV3|nr:hypothetical protein TVAGG3_0714030 [Trichomonas vaginalis G3]EAX87863.1 hypothetical protein TVAG_352160 [Trichomonas vaginalis G3]KAI5510124.1 hypothetical protein TVAGG3_0714030 [Trichomonas vaginalis G3]|eukprot:XP_001300793.1 hypothetical protein [Trichomonas vaginalis G3]
MYLRQSSSHLPPIGSSDILGGGCQSSHTPSDQIAVKEWYKKTGIKKNGIISDLMQKQKE